MSQGKLIDAALAFAIAAIFIIALVFTMDIEGNLLLAQTQVTLPCPSKLIFSVPCPFCGISRSFVALMHGDIAASLRFHVLGWLMALAFITTLTLTVPAILRKSEPIVERKSFITGCQILVAIFVLAWIIKIAF